MNSSSPDLDDVMRKLDKTSRRKKVFAKCAMSSGQMALTAGVLLFAGVIFTWNPFIPSHDVDESPSVLKLRGARGQVVEFLITGRSMSAHWASDTGLTVAFDDDGATTIPLQAAPKHPQDWGDELFYFPRGQNRLRIVCDIRIPQFRTGVTHVDGMLVGSIGRPGQEVIQLQTPVQLALTSSATWQITDGVLFLWSVGFLTLGAVAITVAIRVDRQRQAV